jgi:hypothetical protein
MSKSEDQGITIPCTKYSYYTVVIESANYSSSSGSSAMVSIPENKDRSPDRSPSPAEVLLLDSSVAGDNAFARLEGEESDNPTKKVLVV